MAWRRRPPSSRRGRRCVSGSSWVRRRSSTGVRSAPPPNQALRGDDEARVHVHRRHVRIPQVRDQRDAGGPEARVLLGAGDFLAEFRRELAVHGRAMHADLLEHAAVHHRHHAAAAGPPVRALQGVRSKRPGARPPAGPAGARLRALRRPRRCRRAGVRTRRGRAPCGFEASLLSRSAWTRSSELFRRGSAADIAEVGVGEQFIERRDVRIMPC